MSLDTLLINLQGYEGSILKNLPCSIDLNLKNKSFSRMATQRLIENEILDNISLNEMQKEHNFHLKTVPVNFGSFVPLENMLLVNSHLKDLYDEKWEDSELCHLLIKKILIIPFLVKDRNLGQQNREIGKSFIWQVNEEETNEIKTEWSLFRDYIRSGSIPNTLDSEKKFLTEKDTQFIHMRPHASKGKFEYDKFGNKVRNMCFMFNKGFLRSIILKNK